MNKIKIVYGSIWDVYNSVSNISMCHCISNDKALGAGIAVEFEKRFKLRDRLKKLDTNVGDVILMDGVFNLITKEKYYHKPTPEAFCKTINSMVNICELEEIKVIVMPCIGCGLDKISLSFMYDTLFNAIQNRNVSIFIVTDELTRYSKLCNM